MDFWQRLFDGVGFMPHGHCYLWAPEILWLHVVSDALIGLAYYSIPILLFSLVRRRRDLAFGWMFVMFAVFILACGTTHFMDIFTTWHPSYRLEGVVKGITALASVGTAALLVPLIPKALALPSTAQLEAKNDELRREVEERRRVAAELRQAEAIIAASDDAIVSRTLAGVVTSWNPGAARMLGYSAQEIVGHRIHLLIPPDRQTEVEELNARVLDGERIPHFITKRRRKDGVVLDVSISLSPVSDAEGRITGAATIVRDITAEKRTEEALRHGQKLESLGVLAGGVAHDFNNLLGAVLGQATLALKKLSPENPARGHIEKAVSAVDRAADLTRQMLAYSGRGHFQIQPVDLNTLVRENVHLLSGASIAKNVGLRWDLQEGLPLVDADIGQVQQVLMNLILNAAEAVGERPGTVTVSTGTVEIGTGDTQYSQQTGEPLPPASYVTLETRDTGSGMDAQTVARMFEPFFTTKFTGRGLGLAAVLGIIRGHRGGLRVVSVPGEGTAIKVLLPVSGANPVRPAVLAAAVPAGQGTILVVDDEAAYRESLKDTLTDEGFSVLEAADGLQGITLYRERKGDIQLVILDLSMPGMGGEEAFRKMREINPAVKVILCSGYNAVVATRTFVGGGLAGFLQKPFRTSVLLEEIERAVNRT